MKIFSVSASIVLSTLVGFLISAPNLETLISSLVKSEKAPAVHKISNTSLKLLTNLSGSYSGNGYHNYGTYSLDVSSLPANSTFTIYWATYTIPNRFTLQNGTASVYTSWQGYATWPGPWGPSGVSTSNTGSLSINKGTASTISLIVESSNSTPPSGDDQWDVTY